MSERDGAAQHMAANDPHVLERQGKGLATLGLIPIRMHSGKLLWCHIDLLASSISCKQHYSEEDAVAILGSRCPGEEGVRELRDLVQMRKMARQAECRVVLWDEL